MTNVMDFYKLEIGDTRGYRRRGGGVLQQVLEPAVHRHRSLAAALQQPIGPGQDALASVDGDKGASGWWYPLLHVTKQALFQFEQRHGRLPAPNDAADADEVVELARHFNRAMAALGEFCGDGACLATLDLDGGGRPTSARCRPSARPRPSR